MRGTDKMAGQDIIDIEILEDGTFKIDTDGISMANHGNAEALIKSMVDAAGGDTTRIKKPGTHVHQHEGIWHTH